MITITNLSKVFKENTSQHTVLKDISFSVEEGGFTSLVGLSGSGKTTLLRIISGLEQEYSGNIMVDNVPIDEYLRDNEIALVSQKYSSFPWMSVIENVWSGNKHASQSRVENLLKRLGIYKFRRYYPGQLSGGMQQRVAIARALLQDTEIILFDEPFGALDAQTRRQIHSLLLSIWKEERKTFLFVTHAIDEALFLSNKVVVLGSHPATIQSIHPVYFPYPRHINLYFTDDFIRLKKSITYRIRAESVTSSLRGDRSDDVQMNIGIFTWVGSSPWFYAIDQNAFENKVSVNINSYESHIHLLEDLLKGNIDAANLTLDLAMRVAENDTRFVIAPPYVLSQGADALVAKTKFNTIQDLRGKRIGVERRGIGHFFVSYLLLKAGMSQDDVEIVDILAHDAGARLLNDEIDAAVLWDPWLLESLRLDDVHIITSSKEHPVLTDALLMKRQTYEKHRKEIQSIKKIWQQSSREIHKEKEGHIVASYLNMTKDELEQSLRSLRFITHETKESKIAREAISGHFMREVEQANKTLDPISKDVVNWSTDFHLTLLEDTNRMNAYKKAIFESVTPDDIVVDLGTGTGILARWAVDAGAKKVYAIEGNNFIASLAKESFSVEPYISKIVLINKYSMNVDLPESVSLIISEIIGNVGDNEGMVPILNDARKRFLSEKGRMLPQSVQTFITPVFSPEIERQLPTVQGTEFGYRDAFIANSFHIAPAKPIKQFQFLGNDEDEYTSAVSFICEQETKFHGFKAYFVAQLSDNTNLSIETLDDIKDNKEGSWRHAFFPINATIDLVAGDKIYVEIHAEATDLQRLTKKYCIRGSVERGGETVASFIGLSDCKF